jgi:hypothetical protein
MTIKSFILVPIVFMRCTYLLSLIMCVIGDPGTNFSKINKHKNKEALWFKLLGVGGRKGYLRL